MTKLCADELIMCRKMMYECCTQQWFTLVNIWLCDKHLFESNLLSTFCLVNFMKAEATMANVRLKYIFDDMQLLWRETEVLMCFQ